MSINKQESDHKIPERLSFIRRITEVTLQNPVLTRTLLALLTSTAVYAVLVRHGSAVSAQEDWTTTNAATLNNGTVPDPTATPIPEEVWDQYRFSLKDKNGVNPDDALISAFFVTENGKKLIFGPSRMEKDQEFHVAGFAQNPGDVVEFELSTVSKADLEIRTSLNDTVDRVTVNDPEADISKAVFEISAARPVDLTIPKPPDVMTQITATLNTIEGDLLEVELDNPTVDLKMSVSNLVTGSVTLDVKSLLEDARTAKIAGASSEGLSVGTVSGNAPEGINGEFTYNGEKYVFDSEQPFLSNGQNIKVGPDGQLVVQDYYTPQDKLFIPSVKVETE